MNIELLGGKNEIGGNKILVKHKGTRILLDFGMSFKQSANFFSEFLQPRKCAALADFFELGLLPDIKGIYRQDYLRHMERPHEDRLLDAVLLSHAHADHAQYIHFLRHDIPIYCTEATKIILQALEDTGSNSCSDLVTGCAAFSFYTNKKGEESRVTRKHEEYVFSRNFEVMQPNKKVYIGCLEIEMVPVDHSLPGACGFIIYSDEGNLVYTGDIRFHGSNGELSRNFVEKAKSAKPTWLLAEGTRIDDNKCCSEYDIKQKITKLISEASGLVFVEFPIRDLDRTHTMYQSAKSNNRKFVVNLKLAYLIDALGSLCPFSLDDVQILVPKKSWGLVCEPGVDKKQVEQDYDTWERPFISHPNSITYAELCKNPHKYVVTMGMWEIGQLIDIKPQDAIWIKSSCEPFCEEMELDEERKKHWLSRFKIREFFAHASGHASGKEIRQMIKEINSKHVIPIHTEHPEMFELDFMNKLFENHTSLVTGLLEKAADYPLIAKLYIPLIEHHARKYPNFNDFDDWLHQVLYFQHLWLSTDRSYGELYRERLRRTEDDLELLNKFLGEEHFRKLGEDLFCFASHPTIYGVNNKLLDFYAELQGMLHFIKQGYNVERIPRSQNNKTPDFKFFKDDESELGFVECKFVHASTCPVCAFVRKYLFFLSHYPHDNPFPIILDTCVGECPKKDLKQESIHELKTLCREIINNRWGLVNIQHFDNGQTGAVQEHSLPLSLVTIENQVAFVSNELRRFLYDDYIIRLAKQASLQLDGYDKAKKYVYVFIELNNYCNSPWEDVDREKHRILEEFRKNHGLDVEIILDSFPKTGTT